MNFALISGAIKAVDGLGMLVEQAAESFYIWTANRPSTKGVLDDIRFKMPK
jgi:shikimate dehydrogenase